MKVTYELDLQSFEAWSGGEDTLSRILDEGKENDFIAQQPIRTGLTRHT